MHLNLHHMMALVPLIQSEQPEFIFAVVFKCVWERCFVYWPGKAFGMRLGICSPGYGSILFVFFFSFSGLYLFSDPRLILSPSLFFSRFVAVQVLPQRWPSGAHWLLRLT